MRIPSRVIGAALAVCLSGCGAIDMSPEDGSPSNFAGLRRAFVNDAAANDSLPRALTSEGLRFVLQPAVRYGLRVENPAAGDRLGLYRYDNGRLRTLETVAAKADGSAEVFELESDVTLPGWFVGKLLPGDGQSSSGRLRQVRLAPLTAVASSRVSVHLFLVGKLTALSDAGAKAAFAGNLLSQLAATFGVWGITLSYTYELVDPDGPALALEFGPVFRELPGTRREGSAHLYLVDSIYLQGALPGSGMILGFAPREVSDLDRDRESRVILNVRGGGATLLATTAAHELGHFFGLRHTTATDLDIEVDRDGSNRDDGFASTDSCQIALYKTGAATAALEFAPSQPYCLYSTRPSCPAQCDLTNLMFPYDCSGGNASQRTLSVEQQGFLRGSLGLLGAQ